MKINRYTAIYTYLKITKCNLVRSIVHKNLSKILIANIPITLIKI
ncbi:hypothetical protein P689_11935 [Candidatus Riesia pediculischaeffi PTSU]|uniref:Uncharacterized protein n=1 Tax=Candidatus Riesia pediculischaeffi PTSU TaxID=1401651 RepID=A0A0C1V6J5_9ENTR|nr:hypothetical protein P689_11935 [Candidatus Riesia pediculischaeffi PTSU]